MYYVLRIIIIIIIITFIYFSVKYNYMYGLVYIGLRMYSLARGRGRS